MAVRLVERREAPPSALFRLVRDHIAAEPVLALARSRDRMIQKMREIAEGLPVPAVSVIVFGSFARGQADHESDIDTLMIRPSGNGELDEAWSASVHQWIDRVAEVSGNRVEVLETDEDDVPARLDREGSVWQDIERDALIIHGHPSTRSDRCHVAEEIKTRPVTMVQVREYLAKAEEFLLAATSELEAERSIAAASLA